jgi:TorA maturation chaperone TorD
MESPRLWKWENRIKLLLMASLAYAFLMTLLVESQPLLLEWLLRYWCHRTGKKVKAAKVPLYRLRAAISRLWLANPDIEFSYQN